LNAFNKYIIPMQINIIFDIENQESIWLYTLALNIIVTVFEDSSLFKVNYLRNDIIKDTFI
jgi:hypothetical protein